MAEANTSTAYMKGEQLIETLVQTDRFRGDRIRSGQYKTDDEEQRDVEIIRAARAAILDRIEQRDVLLAALKECALQIAQIHNRKLTAGEQAALDSARAAIAKAEAA